MKWNENYVETVFNSCYGSNKTLNVNEEILFNIKILMSDS